MDTKGTRQGSCSHTVYNLVRRTGSTYTTDTHINGTETNWPQDLRNAEKKSYRTQRRASSPLTGLIPGGFVDGVFELDFGRQVLV